MKVTLSLDFNADTDTEATVSAKCEGETIMLVHYSFCSGEKGDEHQLLTDFVRPGLSHTVQAKVILAGSELIDSIFSGEDAPSTIEV